MNDLESHLNVILKMANIKWSGRGFAYLTMLFRHLQKWRICKNIKEILRTVPTHVIE